MSFEGKTPQRGDGVWLAPTAVVIGDVVLGEQTSVWFQAVLRGDVYPIRIGRRCNLQDGVVVHVTTDTHATTLGDDVTVGHGAILHGCTVGDHVLVGMGATVLDGATIRPWTMVAAGALVPPGKSYPEGVLLMGAPARVARPINDAERAAIERSAPHYAALAQRYVAGAEVLHDGETP